MESGESSESTAERTERAIALAREAQSRAHAPWSRFSVGAAVVLDDGASFAGCNVESASFGLTLCAERSALSSWIAARPRDARSHVAVVAIVTDAETPTAPCGACRQWISELAPRALVVAEAAEGRRQRWTAAELLPAAFGGGDLPAG